MTTNAVWTYFQTSNEHHVLCDPCRFNGKTIAALKYCSDCSGHMCQICVNTHMRVTSTKHHRLTIIPTKCAETNNAMTSRSQGASQSYKAPEMICPDHKNAVVSYCLVHEDLCCRVCIGTTHRECKQQLLSDAAAGTRNSREMRSVESGIKTLQSRFENAQKEKQSNLHHLTHQNDTFTNAVKNYRSSINNILDKLEQTLLKRKERHYETKAEQLGDCFNTCQQSIDVLSESLRNIDIAVKQNDEQQMFLTLKKVQAIYRRYEKVYACEVEKLPKHYAFHFQPDVSTIDFIRKSKLRVMGKHSLLRGTNKDLPSY